ncbi:hypothetical protein P154DRAFT_621152 [Amniculicola lignicola CBS 123094]|uniref:Uncharacterized protein n=1 Tax=Amniculicola lignicola CBS 123094 TaxID=1392246 RepID=A0A6A5WDX0_9PLEO|nr:hypothetical protein P154DRAFT_621152 [Amniculicola lignicola CBS 123094]
MSDMTYHQRGSAAQYRQAEYRDGKVIRIEQCRRQSHVIDLHQPSTSFSRALSSSTISYSSSSQSESSEHTRSSSSSTLTSTSENSVKRTNHVTQRVSTSVRPQRKSKAVVIHMPTPVAPEQPKVTFFEQSELPTPPPTPKFERLPTPDLPDLVESAFCDCCVDDHVAKNSRMCRSSMQSYYV